VFPTSDTVFPTSDTVFPTSDTVFPTSDAVFPTSDAVFPTSDAVFPTSDAVFPTSDAVFPTLLRGSLPTKSIYNFSKSLLRNLLEKEPWVSVLSGFTWRTDLAVTHTFMHVSVHSLSHRRSANFLYT